MIIERKKKLGAYYTPELVTNTLCDWAIRLKNDKILEPSFGGCNFLVSSLNSLIQLGNLNPKNNIYGFDIDPNAFKILNEKKLNNPNFVLGDFLQINNEQNLSVEAIIGNPPFLRIHKMDESYRKELFLKFKGSKTKVAKRSSLWVYFIVHSLQYLKEGGRMAWIVPDSISFTDYSKVFLEQLEKKFKKINLIRIEERFFYESGTSEKTSILLCEGYLEDECKIEISNFSKLNYALKAIKNYDIQKPLTGQEKKIDPLKLNDEKKFEIVKLKTVFDIRIGIVVGASKLLIFNESKAKLLPFYPKYVYPIISKGKQLNGISINKKQLIDNSNTPIFITDAINMETQDQKLFENFLLGIPTEVLLNQTFQNRNKLFGYDDFNHPEAFLTYYSQDQAKIILNEGKELNCTNSVHRLYLKKEYKKELILIKFFALQTYSDVLFNETRAVAREYGNNIFKFEPSDAGNIPLIIPKAITAEFKKDITKLFNASKRMINNDKHEEAKLMIMHYMTKIIN